MVIPFFIMYCKTEECENYAENAHTQLCASCGRIARKQPKEPKRSKINPISKKKSKALAAKIRVYKEMDDKTPHICSGCGSGAFPLSHSHIIPVSQHLEFEAELKNIVYDCLTIGEHKGCHDIWEHGTTAQKELLLNYTQRMTVIKELSPSYLKRVLLKL